jgi:DNA helicase-2/ATP-dependent DNA helicase PcrA
MTYPTETLSEKKTDKPELTPSQNKAVNHSEGPLLVIAGPGSGKTRVITYRIAALIQKGVHPLNICAITFTNKAAEQMKDRVYRILPTVGAGMQISTFHSLCVKLLRQYGGYVGIKPNFSIYDTSDQKRGMKEAIKSCDLDTSNFSPAKMLGGVSRLKNDLVEPRQFIEQADDFFSKNLGKIYEKYQQILSDKNALDFDDLLMKTAVLLRDNQEIRERISNRYKYLLIDEYQDTNHCQYQIAKHIASSHSNICATGDPDQSIYRWRGADLNNILDFEKDWPDAEVVKLQENFRSTPNILTVADKLIANNTGRKLKKLIPVREGGKDIEVCAYDDDKVEAEKIAEKIQKLKSEGASLSNIAVFYRVNSMSRVIEEAFMKHNVAYQIVRGVEFYARKEIRDVLAYLRVLFNPDDELSLLRIINTPTRGIGKTTIGRVQAFAERNNISMYDAMLQAERIESVSAKRRKNIKEFAEMLEDLRGNIDSSVAPQIENVIDCSGLLNSLQNTEDGESAIENIYEFVNSAADYDKQNDQPNLTDFIQQISLFSDTDSYDESAERVSVMTLHSAKGLEFENVFIAGLEEGLLPHGRSIDEDDEVEEERRLFFVGTTRAESWLSISYAEYRTFRGQFSRTIPSRFLREIGIGVKSDEDDRLGRDSEINIPSPQTSEDKKEFRKGELVRHPKFGLGKVVKFNDLGANSVIKIKFNSGHMKTLLVKYANLTKAKK